MPHFRLAALSARAQEFRGGEGGGSDLRLPLDRPTRIGRAVGNDVQLPANWIQISSNHCSLLYDTEQVGGAGGLGLASTHDDSAAAG